MRTNHSLIGGILADPLTVMVTASEEASVRARVDPPQIKVGDGFQLFVEVLGSSMTHFPELPDVFDFAVLTPRTRHAILRGGRTYGTSRGPPFTITVVFPGEEARQE